MAQAVESDLKGKIPSWAGLISVIESDETPAASMIPKRKRPSQVTHNWQVKQYKTTGHSGVIDGQDANNFSSNPRVELQGVSQKSWDNPSVSDFADEADIDGASNEMAEQILDAGVAVKWIIEKRLLSDSDCQLQSGSGASIKPNETRGLFSWGSNSAQSQYPVDSDYRPATAQQYSGTLAAFDEDDYLPMSRSSFKVRRGPNKMAGVVGIDLKAKFTDFSQYAMDASGKTAARTLESKDSAKTYIRCIDKLVLDTGVLDLYPSTFIRTDASTGEDSAYTHSSGIFFDPEKVWLAFTRKPRFKMLENKGGGKRGIFDTIFIVGCDNPKSIQMAEINS